MKTESSASIGWSARTRAFDAGQEAAHLALQGRTPSAVQCAIVLGSSWFDQRQLLEGVQSMGNGVPVIGGSTAGEIVASGPKTHSCVVMVLADQDLKVGIGASEGVDQEPRQAGCRAAQQAVQGFAGQTHQGFLFFGDGLLTGYGHVCRGIQERLGTNALIVGGLMGDDLRFTRTHQYAYDMVMHGAVAGLLLGGSRKLGVGIEHGFAPISRPREITRASENVLYELDGRPAVSMYEEYFGKSLMMSVRNGGLSRRLIAYPLGVQVNASDGVERHLLRSVMAFREDGGLACTGEITEGAHTQLMIGSKSLALAAATRAAQQAIQGLSSVSAVLVFDSVERKRLLGRDAATEIENIRRVIGPTVPLAGCYTYGEQAPVGGPSLTGRSSAQTGAILVIAFGQ